MCAATLNLVEYYHNIYYDIKINSTTIGENFRLSLRKPILIMVISQNNSTKSEIENFLKQNPDIISIDVLIPTFSGHLRGKRIPIRDADKIIKGGVQLPSSIPLLDLSGANCFHLPEGGEDGDPDFRVMPVAGTICRVPWVEEPRAQILGYQTMRHGMPFYGDPRRLLNREVRRFRAMGLKPIMAFEFEFYLCKSDLGADGAPILASEEEDEIEQNDIQCLGMQELEAFDTVLNEVNEALETQGMEPCSTSKEYAPCQYEVNLSYYEDPLVLCDQAMMYRRAIKAIARKHGLEATFMAKPFGEWAGSGLHTHLSILDENGKNIFEEGIDDEGEPKVNDNLLHAIGGSMKYTKDFMMLLAPNANSYRRYSKATAYSPVNSAWNVNDRSVAYRVPLSDARNTRLEHRVAGADANPYFVATAILASVRKGLMDKITPPERAERGTGFDYPPKFPTRWLEAILAFKKSAFAKEVFGKMMHEKLHLFHLSEFDAYESSMQPSDFTRYFRHC